MNTIYLWQEIFFMKYQPLTSLYKHLTPNFHQRQSADLAQSEKWATATLSASQVDEFYNKQK